MRNDAGMLLLSASFSFNDNSLRKSEYTVSVNVNTMLADVTVSLSPVQ